MHVAPLVLIDHAAGPDGWLSDIRALAAALESHPDLPLTVRMPGAGVDLASRMEPEAWARLRRSEVCWLAGGWSSPVLVHLPPRARAIHLERERGAMESAGIAAAGLWVGEGWEPDLITLALDAGLDLVTFDAGLLEEGTDRPGAVDRAGATILAVPVTSAVARHGGDGLSTVRVAPTELERLAVDHRGSLTTPERYLEGHLPGPRLAPTVTVPARSPDTEPFYRTLLLATATLAAKGTGNDALLALQSGEFTTGAAVDVAAHRRLLETRRDRERSSRRGDAWVVVSEVDWDADGCDEVEIETWSTSLIVDPAAGSVDLWEDKVTSWPITSVRPTLSGVLMRVMDGDGGEPPARPMHLERRAEGRAEAEIVLASDDGSRARVHLVGEQLSMELTVASTDPIRIGPEVPLSMDSRSARVRVDGGAWLDTSDPLALTGHRFRLTDGVHTMLVSAGRPTELWVRTLDGHGLVIWPHWPTTGDTRYDVRFVPS